MKFSINKILSLLLLLTLILALQNNNNKIIIRIQAPDTKNLKINNLWTFQIINKSKNDYSIIINGEIKSDTTVIFKAKTSKSFIITSGFSIYLNIDDIKPIIIEYIDDSIITQNNKESKLPKGIYTMCVYCYDKNTKTLIAHDCIFINKRSS